MKQTFDYKEGTVEVIIDQQRLYNWARKALKNKTRQCKVAFVSARATFVDEAALSSLKGEFR